jgi:hypothetical protein
VLRAVTRLHEEHTPKPCGCRRLEEGPS